MNENTKWEYLVLKVLDHDRDSLREGLDILGAARWELVQCDFDKHLFIFKRPRKENEELYEQKVISDVTKGSIWGKIG